MSPPRVFIQARISSARFPAKVLAPLRGKPIISHVVRRALQAVPRERLVVTTSTEATDDPLAAYVRELGVAVFRGPLENVFVRFQMCLERFPCDWFFRVCADSPLLDATLMTRMMDERRNGVDLVTNVQQRTFPRGQSLELLNSQTFAGIDPGELSAEEQEHVTKVYYTHPERFHIVNLVSAQPELAHQSLAVDTIDDLRRIEQLPVMDTRL
ncbi:MAG: NTP transferase domain-containing protein [Verrucomicrobia bacterium]|nr:NTP transferase domain-containing protein [Verrucomicrobiota bacterium]